MVPFISNIGKKSRKIARAILRRRSGSRTIENRYVIIYFKKNDTSAFSFAPRNVTILSWALADVSPIGQNSFSMRKNTSF